MREGIGKYRGEDLCTRELVYGCLVLGVQARAGQAFLYPDDAGFGEPVQVDPYTVGEFSGLCDSEGEELFDGDTVPLAGYGDYFVEFPYAELYEAAAENDIGVKIGK